MAARTIAFGRHDGLVTRGAAEWLARVEEDARAREARRALGLASGIADDEVLEGLRRLGVTPQALPALEMVPPILVGWAEGRMSRLERDRLRAVAAARGIDEAHPAWPLVQHWMLQQPAEEETGILLAALCLRLEHAPVRQRLKRRQTILSHCEAIARAAGPTLGGPKISRQERDVLARLESRLPL